MYYKIRNGNITLGGNIILENINFSVTDHEKIGIVGRNGTGKTTLLKGLIGELDFEDGYEKVTVEKTNDFTIGYVKQNSEINSQKAMLDYILEAYKNLTNIEKKLKCLEEKMLTNYTDRVLNDYNNLTNSYQLNGGYDYKKEYELALKSFGFTKEDQEKKLNEFSGGQLTKLAFLKLLLEKPDLLILDEPTNHLDLPTIEWLEDYLKKYKKSLIVVSHDQMFLDNVCNVIYDLEYGNLKRYNGNYSEFIKQKERDYEKQLKDYEMQQKEIKRLQAIVDKFRYKPTKASMAMAKLKQIEKMTIIEKPKKENQKTFKISFDPEQESYKEVLKIKNLSIGYNSQELCKIDLIEVNRGDKIGIIGPNGSGKSTFLRTILREIPKLGGKFIFGKNTNIAYFSQQLENLDPNKTIYEEIESSFPSLSQKEIRTLLGTFEFTKEDVFKYIKELSGGEKVIVSLCKLLYTKPNVLILDEPTNHLDIISKSTIEKLLKNYRGTVIMVSHDRYLIKNVCTRLFVFKDKEVEIYNYGYQEYLEKRNEFKEDRLDTKKEKKSSVPIQNQYTINKEVQRVERKITNLEKEIDRLTNELYKKEIYANPLKSSQIQKEIDNLQEELNENVSLWEKLLNKMN